ncbi:MAG: hypothetical protein AAF570_00580, partial [Bacteroidota bacterium]
MKSFRKDLRGIRTTTFSLVFLLITANLHAQSQRAAADADLAKGKHLILCSKFYEALPVLHAAAKSYERLSLPALQLEALFQAEWALDMTFQNEARARLLDQLETLSIKAFGKTSTYHHRTLVQRADHLFDVGKSDSARKLLITLMPEFEATEDRWALSSGHLLLG